MRAEIRRGHILDATEGLLLEVGSTGLTMRSIATSSGISLGNLQYHFPTREDVLLALLNRFLTPYEERLGNFPERTSENVAEALGFVFKTVLNDPDFDRCATIYKEIWAASNHSEEMRNALNNYYRRLAEFYRKLLSNVAAPQADPEKIGRAAAAMLPVLEGYCVTKDAVDFPIEETVEDWSKMIAGLVC